EEAVPVLSDVDDEVRRRRESLVLLRGRLAGVGRQGRDVDQGGHVRVHAGLRDDRTAPGVTHQYGGAVLPFQHARGRPDVVFKRGQRILHDGDVVATRCQVVAYAAPPGTVDKRTVHQDDVPDLLVG